MPSNFMVADNSFPVLTGEQSTNEKFRIITNYLYQLLEQLRYTLANLGQENFNETELNNLANIITEPVIVRLEDDEGNLAELSQTIDGLSITATNGEATSTLKLKSGSTELSSAQISFSGMVTFNNLSTAGQTTINGDNITTGMLTGLNIRTKLATNGQVSGEHQFLYANNNNPAGGIRLDDQGAGSDEDRQYRMIIYTKTIGGRAFNLKLDSAAGLSLKADDIIYQRAGTDMVLRAGGKIELTPGNNSKVYIGSQTLDAYIQDVVNNM